MGNKKSGPGANFANTLKTQSYHKASTSDYIPVNIILSVCRKVIVYDKGNLLHINSSSLE
jgi:hypothetical protein